MRTNRELLIATRAFADENSARSWWHICSTFAVLGLLGWAICRDTWWVYRLPWSILLGFVIVRMFVLYHDHQHGAICRGSRLADWIMRGIGLLVLSPSSGWKRSHDNHHAQNSKQPSRNVGSFCLWDVETFRNSTRFQRGLYVAERHPITILAAYLSVFLFGMCLRPFLANPRRHFDGLLAILLHVSLLCFVGFYSIELLILGVLIPHTIASALGAFLFYAQHNFAGARIYSQKEWEYCDAALNSSSYIKMGPVLRWLTGNIGYHHIHHLNSRIPFYRLPETMASLEELQSPVTISLGVGDIRRCFQQNLWDRKTESLVSWSALQTAPTAPVHGQMSHCRD